MQKIKDLYDIYSVQVRGSQNPADKSFEILLELDIKLYLPEEDNSFYDASGFNHMKEAKFFKKNFSEMLNECYFGGMLPEISKKFVLESDEPREAMGFSHHCTAKAFLTKDEFQAFDENYDISLTERYDIVYAEDEKTARKDETISNLKMAKQLVHLARELIAVPVGTFDDYNKFNNQYKKDFGVDADSGIWELFKTESERDNFLKQRKNKHPNWSQVISKETLKKLLEEGWFTICSAGLSSEENKILSEKCSVGRENLDLSGYEKEKDSLVKSRLEELRNFLDSLNCPYYEVIGQFFDREAKKQLSELSFIIDLSDIGKNSESDAKSLMDKIISFCGNEMNQTAVIEGIKGIGAYVFCKDKSNMKKQNIVYDIKQIGGEEGGRSTVLNNEKDYSKSKSWKDEYPWSDSPNKTPWR